MLDHDKNLVVCQHIVRVGSLVATSNAFPSIRPDYGERDTFLWCFDGEMVHVYIGLSDWGV